MLYTFSIEEFYMAKDDQTRMPEPDEEPQFETNLRALAILERILQETPPSDPRFGMLELLRTQLRVDERQFEEARNEIEKFNDVYDELTAPANKLATYLGKFEGEEDINALIALGDQEYFTNVDPKAIDIDELKIGARVRVNEAFVLLEDLGFSIQGPIVKVSEVLDEERIRVATDTTGGGGRIIVRSAELMGRELKAGDEVRLDPSARVALEYFEKNETQDFYLEEVPQIPWDAIGGQEDAIGLIKDTIERPLLHPELYERFGKRPLKGILLYGPPGCGKTLIGKATAYNLTKTYAEHVGKDIKHYFMLINGPKLLNMWLGETERMVREVFAQARERAKEGFLVFIFIDEADSILRTRSSGRYMNISNTVVPQFAAEMDGLVSMRNVVVMLTSNRPDYIDPAILRPERIDRKVKINRPNRAAISDIYGIYLDQDIPLDADWVAEYKDENEARAALVEKATEYLCRENDETAFLDIALRSGKHQTLYWKDLCSGALIMSSVERAKDLTIRRAIDNGDDEAGISWDDLQQSIKQEFSENEIFPKTDNLEDWLKLLDHEPENVVEIRPAREQKGRDRFDSVV
jgi:proteasome-associated ATPase